MIDVRFQRGLFLPAHDLWLDPWDDQPCAFVSHAHSDHIGNHREIIVSEGTSRLMQARLPGTRHEHVLYYEETVEFRGLRITLLPAGHIFGSAQIHIEAPEGSLLYTGDFKLRPGLSAEPCTWRHAETLIMETTYGLPKYRMPPTETVMEEMLAFCREALEEGATPILLGYSLGKSQEILCALLKHGFTPMLHGSVYRMTEIYRQLQPDFPTGYVRYAPSEMPGKVLVCPPSAARSLMLQKIKNRRTAVLTGWALDPGAKFRYGCDAAFPLTDHADYPDLVRYVELVEPKRILTLHGFASAFASDLRQRGYEAWALTQENQLELLLPEEPTTVDSGVAEETEAIDAERPTSPPPDQLRAFAELGEQIAATSSKLRKTELLAGYLASLAESAPEGLPIAAIYLTGRPFAQTDPRVLQTGWAVIMRALASTSKRGVAYVGRLASTYSDAGKTAYELLLGRPYLDTFSLPESRAFFERLQAARGPHQKTDLLQQQLEALGPLEASYVVKILTGDLRIGLREGLVEEAIAVAFETEADSVREANMLLGDLGEAAVLASRGALHEASIRLFRPVKCMLASPEPTAEAIFSRLQEATPVNTDPAAPGAHPYWVEDKYDGIRAQLHIGPAQVEIFTRDLKNVTQQFSDVARTAREFPRQAIFDGEILAFDEGRKLTFFDLQKRLGRKNEDDLFLGSSDIPVIYRAFDLLWLDGESLLRQPLTKRRALLETLAFPSGLELTPITPVHSPDEVENTFRDARQRGNEGLIAKDGASLYTPGRRGLSWLKLKKELATLDVVVVGAELGHGKRAGVLSDYTFAVRDDETGSLLTIGKAYSGVTDEEIDELTERFRGITIANHGRYREVKPEVVLEVAFDTVQPSQRHSSGLALRFPRIKAIRRDKTPADIDTLSYARTLTANSTVPQPTVSTKRKAAPRRW